MAERRRGEEELRDRLNEHVDDEACGGKRGGKPAQGRAPAPDHLSADLCHGQERVGTLAQEADQDASENIGSNRRRKQDKPPEAGACDRHSTKQADACNFETRRLRTRLQPGPRPLRK